MDLNEHLETEHAFSSAKYIKNIIYGGLDGIITTFSIIAAAVGANLDERYVIAMGVANLFADAISMGVGEYLSLSFENNYILSEKKKEENEFEKNRESEINELVELYEKEGLKKDDSKKIVNILASKPSYKPIFIKYMLQLELGLDIPDNNPKKSGLVTFISFMIFGSIPVLCYILLHVFEYGNYTLAFVINSVISLVSIFILGVLQSIITKQDILKCSLKLTLNGFIASSTAFLIGYGIEKLIV